MNPITTSPAYISNDADAAVERGQATSRLFAMGERDKAYDFWKKDPTGGVAMERAGGHLSQHYFELQMYSVRDPRGVFKFPQPEGFKHMEYTNGQRVVLKDGGPGKLRQIAVYGDAVCASVLLDQPIVEVDRATDRVFVTMDKVIAITEPELVHYDLYSKGGEPVALVLWRTNEPQPYMCLKSTGKGLVPFTVISDGDVPASDSRSSATHVNVELSFKDGKVIGASVSKEGHSPKLLIGRAHPAPVVQERLSSEQFEAVAVFRERNGRTWKSKLAECWASGSYRGVDKDHAPLLQQVRNQFGPVWLSGVQPAFFTPVSRDAVERVGESLLRRDGVVYAYAPQNFGDGLPMLFAKVVNGEVDGPNAARDAGLLHFLNNERSYPASIEANDVMLNKHSGREHWVSSVVDGRVFHTDGVDEFVNSPAEVFAMCTIARIESQLVATSAPVARAAAATSPSCATPSNGI